MIAFVTTRAGRHTIDDYLAGIAVNLRRLVTVWTYEDLARRFAAQTLPNATIVFTDIERLTATEAERAAHICDALAATPERWRTLNHPRRTLRRLPLLERLYAEGVNDFRAWPATREQPDDVQFPVFLRIADDHAGARSDLLHDRSSLSAAVRDLDARWIACEYRPHVGEGAFIKYGAFILRGQIHPRHVMFSPHWIVKSNELTTSRTMHASWVYLNTNPHADTLAHIARLAYVDYGRIDYVALPNGRVRVWEINTNPHLCSLVTLADRPRRVLHDAWHQRFAQALRALDLELPSGRATPTILDRMRWRALRSTMPMIPMLGIERAAWRWAYWAYAKAGRRG